MRTQFHHNLTIETLAAAVKEISGEDCAGSATMSLVYAKDNCGQWAFFIGSCKIGEADRDVRYVYEDFAFIQKTYTNMSLYELVQSLDRIGEDIGSGYQALGEASNLPCTESVIPSFLSKGKFPFRRFAVSLSKARGSYNLGGPLVGYDLPYQPSARFYVKEFLKLSRYHGESDGDNGSFSIYVEDRRGRIILNADNVQIESGREDLMLIGQLSGVETLSLNVGEVHQSSHVDIESSDLWLIDRKNHLLDFVATSHTLTDLYRDRSTSDAYIELIERGEGHTCEFKSYIDLVAKNNAKAEQIERTVCAFSNATGGKLLIGVSDDGVIEGVDERVAEDYKTSVDDALILYTKAIRKRLNEKLRNGQCAKIETVDIGGKRIVEIDITRSSDVNYYLGTKLGYVRRGATSTKMTAADHREPLEKHGFI